MDKDTEITIPSCINLYDNFINDYNLTRDDIISIGSISGERDQEIQRVYPGPDGSLCFQYVNIYRLIEPEDITDPTKVDPYNRKTLIRTRLTPDQEKAKGRKYNTKKGSKSKIFWTEPAIKAFEEKRKVKTLPLLEGEKKSLIASKLGILCAGISGIHATTDRDSKLFDDCLIDFINVCQVENIVIIHDADAISLKKINESIAKGTDISTRLYSFAAAVKKPFELSKSLNNIEFYYTHILPEFEDKAKGLDDLFYYNLKDPEPIVEDFYKLTRSTKYFKTYKIKTEYDIDKIFYQDKSGLKRLYNDFNLVDQEFIWKNSSYIGCNGEPKLKGLELSDYIYNEALQFWDVYYNKDGGKDYKFNYVKLYAFLTANGFFNLKRLSGDAILVRNMGGIVHQMTPLEIKSYIIEFLNKHIKDEKILNMIYRGSSKYIGSESLSNLITKSIDFIQSGKTFQYMHFRNESWKISEDTIEVFKHNQDSGYVWHKKVIDFDITLMDELFTVKNNDDTGIEIVIKKDHNSEFLQFLINTSNPYWREEQSRLLTEPEKTVIYDNLKNKFSVIGYLLHRYRDDSKTWCVVAMDFKLSPVGESMGGTGKSMLANAISQVLNTATIEGKKRTLTDDPFIYQNLTETTDLILVDDARLYLDFEFFYTAITGTIKVNQKGKQAWDFPKHLTPKLLITTNHTIGISDDSANRRLFKTGFSDYYGKHRTPSDDFNNHIFFTKDYWPAEQWNLFYNLLARCIQFYLKYGKIDIVTNTLEKRRLRQSIGESFLEWAELKFNNDNLFVKLSKQDLFEDAKQALTPDEKSRFTTQKFKKKLRDWCQYASDGNVTYELNPDLVDVDGKPLPKFSDKILPKITYDKEGRILERDANGKTSEFIFITRSGDSNFLVKDLPYEF